MLVLQSFVVPVRHLNAVFVLIIERQFSFHPRRLRKPLVLVSEAFTEFVITFEGWHR